jgi:tripartite-type tricarboxylate transporter receptor subunit TctC
VKLIKTAFKTLFCIALTAGTAVATAQGYPAKPIRWIVPYTAGGLTDTSTRLVTNKIAASIGQPVLIDNRPGANAIIGADLAAKAAPDGYTVVTVIAAHAANHTLYAGKLPFETMKSFEAVSVIGIAPLMVAASTALPAKDIKELIAYGKANPGKISFGSTGAGSAAHLTTEMLKQSTGIDMVHVPYKGGAQAVTALMSGDIQLLVDAPSTLMTHVRSGRIKPLAALWPRRISGVPEVPTIVEAGGPALEATTWLAVLAPAGTPQDIVQRLSQETAKALAQPDVKERLNAVGIETVGGTPEQTAKFINDEIAKWAKVIRDSGTKAE